MDLYKSKLETKLLNMWYVYAHLSTSCIKLSGLILKSIDIDTSGQLLCLGILPQLQNYITNFN